MAKVSVIMPCYNHERFLPAAIDSVLSQSFGDLELIVTDDCSWDRSREIIQKYSTLDKRILPIYHEHNGGEAKSRNDALSKATGEYIAYCDSDDVWEERKLEKQVSLLEKHKDYNVCHSDSLIIDENGVSNGTTFNSLYQKDMQVSGDIFHQFCMRNVINIPTVLMRKKCIEDAGYFELGFKYSTDWIYWVKVARKSKFLYISESLARYRVHNGSTAKDKMGYFPCRIKAYNLILELFPEIPDAIKSIIYYSLGEQFYYLHERERAKEYYLTAIKANTSNYKAYVRLFFPALYRDTRLG